MNGGVVREVWASILGQKKEEEENY